MKRLCLFAGYSSKNIIEDYVVYYLKELSSYADICYCADCNMSDGELEKIKPYVKHAVAFHHKRYDFGSWGILYQKIDKLDEYDELILANDSTFGPLYPLKNIFDKMQHKDVSAWALCGNKFMMSFFVVLRREVFLTEWFADFLTSVKEDISKCDIVRLYEKGITRIIDDHGLKWDCLFSKYNLKQQVKENSEIINAGLKTIPLSIRL